MISFESRYRDLGRSLFGVVQGGGTAQLYIEYYTGRAITP